MFCLFRLAFWHPFVNWSKLTTLFGRNQRPQLGDALLVDSKDRLDPRGLDLGPLHPLGAMNHLPQLGKLSLLPAVFEQTNRFSRLAGTNDSPTSMHVGLGKAWNIVIGGYALIHSKKQ
jgi:hypothetical protein